MEKRAKEAIERQRAVYRKCTAVREKQAAVTAGNGCFLLPGRSWEEAYFFRAGGVKRESGRRILPGTAHKKPWKNLWKKQE